MGCKTLALMEVLLATWVAATPAAAISAWPPGADAPSLALLTIADGEVAVLRGRMRFVAVEGQHLLAQDIVHTSAATRVARLEFSDGSVLDLGPATQVLLSPQGGAWPKERPAMAYVVRGWAKLRAPRAADGASATGLASAWLDVAAPQGGVVLARIEPQAAFAFVESGRAQLVEYRAARAPRELALGEGHAYQRDAGAELGIASLRPAAAVLRATPRALADALPLRAASFAQRPEPPVPPLQPLAPGDTAAWLDTEPALRAAMHARFGVATPIAARGAVSRTDRALKSAAPNAARARPPAATPAPGRVAQLGHQRLAESRAPTTGAAMPIVLEPTELVAVQPVLGSAPLPDAALPSAVVTPASPAATPIAPAKPVAAATATPPPKPTSARAARRARTES
jgi:hypothetical protein